MNRHGQTVCLSMIVKNEAGVIRRCIDSVRPIIDSWAIVDTGSTDGTQGVIREHLADLPGTLIERPWVDFAHNRTEALEYARGAADYTFVIDADEVLKLDDGYELPLLEDDAYSAEMSYGGCTYLRRVLVRSALPWRYRGVIHEYIECPDSRTESLLSGLHIEPHTDGARSRDPRTYRRDALAIERALIDEPDDERYVFYLAQSYRDAGDFELALRHYRRRAEMGGWIEEVWYSRYQIAVIRERMGDPWAEVMQDFLTAYELHPLRAEPLYRVGLHYQQARAYRLANLFLEAARRIPFPRTERLFVERTLYDYAIALEHGVSCYYVGDHERAIATANELLASPALPPELIEQVTANRRYSLDALAATPGGARALSAPHLTVVVPFLDPGPALDECVESLMLQGPMLMSTVFVDLGSRDDHAARLPLDRAGYTLRDAAGASLDDAVRAIAGELAPEDVVLVLSSLARLVDPTSARTLSDMFADLRCLLAYGGHRDADGRPVRAEPAPSARAHADLGVRLAGSSAIAFRARLAGPAGGELLADAWSAAGFDGTRFCDETLTATASTPAAAPTRGGARPPASEPLTATASSPAAAPAPGGARPPASEPLVSCLLVTRDRLALTKLAIRSFAEQTHRNRELVIVTDGDGRFRAALERHVAALGSERIRFVYPDEEGQALGALRNLSMDEARGDVLCQWDDDDYSHPERIACQLASMREQEAASCLLSDHLQLHARDRLVYWVDWSDAGRLTGIDGLAPGSIMLARDPSLRYPTTGEHARRGEDSVLLAELAQRGPIARLEGQGHLWLYTYHGRNTFPEEHHRNMSAFGMPRARLLDHADVIRQALAGYPIPRPATVAGRDGPAFAVR